MPTTNKRVNLSIPNEIYVKLQAYKQKQGISSDAGACLQLISQQLAGLEKTEQLLDLVNRFKYEELVQLSNIGLSEMKALADATRNSTDSNTR